MTITVTDNRVLCLLSVSQILPALQLPEPLLTWQFYFCWLPYSSAFALDDLIWEREESSLYIKQNNRKRKKARARKSLSCVWLFVTPWTVAPQFLCPWNSPGKNVGMGRRSLLQDPSKPGNEPGSPALQADSLPSEPQGKPREGLTYWVIKKLQYRLICKVKPTVQKINKSTKNPTFS